VPPDAASAAAAGDDGPIVCGRARDEDFPAVQQLLELYQYELSDTWEQHLDAQGCYGYNLSRHRQGTRFAAHVVRYRGHWAGCALVAPALVTRTEGCWMEQFFVLKRYRHLGVGTALARHVVQQHPGLWEIGQMTANTAAQAFWRRVVPRLACGPVVELQVTEGWWQGVVQQFESAAGTGNGGSTMAG
jgi:predicted acetyltransferase